jgi:DNA repair exonuclease SbcCD ATPase subunit
MRKMRMKIQIIQEKVEAYETNIQFISKGKSGDGLRNQIQAQIDSEKAEIEKLKKRLKDMKSEQDNAKANAAAAKAAANAPAVTPEVETASEDVANDDASAPVTEE